MTSKLDEVVIDSTFTVYVVRQKSSDGQERDLVFEDAHEALLEHAMYGGTLGERTGYMGEFRAVEPTKLAEEIAEEDDE